MAIYRGTGDTNAGIPQLEGDMLKSVYDINNDGIVDHSALADLASSLDGPANATYVDFDTVTPVAGAVARLKWNNTEGTLDLGLKGGNVTLQLGQEEVVQVYNNTGAAFTDMQVVRITGSSGTRLTAALAQANSEATSATSLAVVTEPIANNNSGFATRGGIVNGVNTNDFNEGDALWLSPSVAGGITNVKPTAPNHLVLIGWCVKKAGGAGQIYVHIQNGYELDELHDVLITSKANGDVLIYNSSTGVWENKAQSNITAGTATNQSGGTINATSGVISANTSSDALRITQIGSGNALLVEDSANPDATPFVITNAGDIVQGATTFTNSGNVAPVFAMVGTASYGPQFVIENKVNDVSAGYSVLRKGRNGSIVASGDSLGAVTYQGYDGASFVNAAQITANVDGTPGTNDMPGRLVFSTTADGASSPTERMRIDNAGRVGIGGTPVATSKLNIGGTLLSSGGFGKAVYADYTVPSTTTSQNIGFQSVLNTQAASFTLGQASHYFAFQGSIGAGSSVTNQMGFFAESNLTGATNNYGFYSNIASGTGRYNFYAAGSADNYFAGKVGIGTSPPSNRILRIGGNTIAASGFAYSADAVPVIQSDVTNSYRGFASQPTTAAASFTLGELAHFHAYQGALGSGSAITSQYGYFVDSSLTGATNNYGFYSNIASGTGRYNFYAAGTAGNYFAGITGIGDLPSANGQLRVAGTAPAVTDSWGVLSQSGSQATSTHNAFYSLPTVSAANALNTLTHYYASQSTLANTVTNQRGFAVESTLTGATNNYGFYGNIAAGANRYNLYMNGTADNYMAGALGIGTTSLTARKVGVGGTVTGATTAYGVLNQPTYQSDVTATANNFYSASFTQATTFTLSTFNNFSANQGTIGAGSAITNQIGFNAGSSLTGATNNYGFYSAIASGSGRYNFYAAGSADNYFAGKVGIGASSPSVNLHIAQSGADARVFIESTNTGASKLEMYASTQALAAYNSISSNYGANVSWYIGGDGAADTIKFKTASTERMRIDAAGNVGIGATPPTNTALTITTAPTGGVNNFGIVNNYTIQSNATTSANYYYSSASTAAAAFTVPTLRHFYANQGTVGAGSAVTSQYGFYVENTLTGATNNYGFSSNIASGTGRYNFYAAGSAANYMAGRLGIGDTTDIGAMLFVNGGLTNSVSYGVKHQSLFASGVTTGVHYSALTYVGASATVTSIKNFQADQSTIGSGATVGAQYGFIAENSLTGATNNYGFYSNIASGTGRYNFYAAGSADNYFAGKVGIGIAPANSLDVTGPWVGGVGTVRIKASSGTLAGLTLQDASAALTYFYADTANNYTFLGSTTGRSLVFATNSGGTDNERMRIDSTGKVSIAGDTIQVNTAKTPASATATGTTGQICWDTNYVYVCVATNTWKRSALTTW